MDATVSVELGAEDAHLEIPWQAGDLRYYDLKRHPELLLELPESHNGCGRCDRRSRSSDTN